MTEISGYIFRGSLVAITGKRPARIPEGVQRIPSAGITGGMIGKNS